MSLASDDAVPVIDFMRTVSARSLITTVTRSELYFGAWRLDEGTSEETSITMPP
ncbi:hypothetical protein [Microlunatus parietis]|uniref:Uncharacterized protein n=1 Tax=Microlunatus parietis TaxID=682979 RepID=A0A7Y9LAG8_9ACTN|nr:hypothetical protein [Microlunatus parietis]NYE69570.1 hypothetical protein [Microlunatus parietis]